MISVVSYLQLFPEFLWNYGCIPTNMRLKLNKSVKKLISNYNVSLSIKMSVSSLLKPSTCLSVFYMKSYDTICAQQPNKRKYCSGLAVTVPIFDKVFLVRCIHEGKISTDWNSWTTYLCYRDKHTRFCTF